jgi:hypothetical protein
VTGTEALIDGGMSFECLNDVSEVGRSWRLALRRPRSQGNHRPWRRMDRLVTRWYSLSPPEGSFCALDLSSALSWCNAGRCSFAEGRRLIRLYSLITVACLLISGLVWSADGNSLQRQPTKISPQALAPALQILAREREIQVVYRSELVEDHRTGGVDGNFTLEEALTRLLSGTGLTYVYLADRAITIVPLPLHAIVPIPAPARETGTF